MLVSNNSVIAKIITFALLVMFLVYVPWDSYKIMQARIKEEQKKKEQKAEVKEYKKNKELNIFMHDLPKKLQIIEEIAIEENASNTAQKVHSLLDNCLVVRMGFFTGNNFLDKELSKMKKEVEKYGINITFDGIFPESGIDESDLNDILYNAFENAIRACNDAEKPREISMSSIIKGNQVYVKITNPYKEKIIVDEKTGKLRSTKSDDGGIHGYGISSIEEIVRSYNGEVTISYDDKFFTLTFFMEYE